MTDQQTATTTDRQTVTTDRQTATTGRFDEIVTRYIAMWNEPDATRRSELVRELWAPDAEQVLVDPPEEIRNAAAALAFPVPALAVRGHDALDARVARAYAMFVEPGEYTFENAAEPVVLMPDVLAVRWAMVSASTGEAAGGGLDVLALDRDGRIRSDHQFIG